MALIICTECSKEFSNKAAACPNCGCPTEEVLKSLSQTTTPNLNTEKPKAIVTVSEVKEEEPAFFIKEPIFEYEIYDNRIEAHELKMSGKRFRKKVYFFSKVTKTKWETILGRRAIYLYFADAQPTYFEFSWQNKKIVPEICDFINSKIS